MSRANSLILERLDDQLVAHFWSKVDRTGECWEWTGGRYPTGYGQFYIARRGVIAHRVSIFLATGDIPGPGLHVDHTCHNPPCVRPDHLRVVTAKQNSENRGGPTRRTRSGVLGVSWSSQYRRWKVTVHHNGQTHFGGSYPDLESAERSAVSLRNRLFTHNDLDRTA